MKPLTNRAKVCYIKSVVNWTAPLCKPYKPEAQASHSQALRESIQTRVKPIEEPVELIGWCVFFFNCF